MILGDFILGKLKDTIFEVCPGEFFDIVYSRPMREGAALDLRECNRSSGGAFWR